MKIIIFILISVELCLCLSHTRGAAPSNCSIPGSGRDIRPGSTAVGPVDPTQILDVTLVLRRDPNSNLTSNNNATHRHKPIGGSLSDIAEVQNFASQYNLTVTSVNQVARYVRVTGTVSQINIAFDITITNYNSTNGTYQGHTGSVHIPSSLCRIVIAVFGLDNRPVAKPKQWIIFPVNGDPDPDHRPRPPPPSPTPPPRSTFHPTPTHGPTPTPTHPPTPTPTPTHPPTPTPTPTHFVPPPLPTPTPTPTPPIPTPTPTVTPSGSLNFPSPVSTTSLTLPFTPTTIGQLYNFPTAPIIGTGQCAVIIEFGGGYYTTDLANSGLVSWVSGDGVAQNSPSTNKNVYSAFDTADGEVALDIQIIQGVAPGARIVVVFSSNNDNGWLAAVNYVYNNPAMCGAGIPIRSVSISWGGAETLAWNTANRDAVNNVFQDLYDIGVVVTASSGDAGSSDGYGGRNPEYVEFPASSPFVLACGGTTVTIRSGSFTETAWSDTGGGVSIVYPKPSYQNNVNVPAPGGRGVPDVAGDADPNSGIVVKYNGRIFEVGGTSAVAPLWAGLVALIGQKIGTGKVVGPLQPLLYTLPASANAFRDITSGSNGGYSASVGWDPCTGLGSPNGANLVNAIAQLR